MGAELSLEEKLKQGLITPGTPIPLYQNVEISFQKDTLSELKEQHQKIHLTESKKSSPQGRKLLVTVEGIHTGMTKNKTFYPGNTLQESIPTWTNPHKKPVIKNHNLYSEPLGRIVQAEYVESILTDKYTVRLKLEITDEDAITKILDGRYLTLSVGGSANKVTCSVCSKDLVTEGYCGHRRGQKYEGKEAYWIIAGYTGDEISFVNQPADVHSQVISAELVTVEGGKKMGDKNSNTKTDPVENLDESKKDPTALIDGLLSEGDQDPKDPTIQEGDSDNDNPDHGDTKKPKESGDDNDDLEKVKEDLKAANARITELEGIVEAKDAEITTLTATVSEKEDELEQTKKHLASAESEKQAFIDQNITLARFARKSMAERVADLRIAQGKNKLDERESLISEWSQSSSRVLETQIQDLLSSQRQVEKVHSPGQVIAEKNAPIVDEEDNEIETHKESKQSANKTKPKTLKDFESGVKRSIFRD